MVIVETRHAAGEEGEDMNRQLRKYLACLDMARKQMQQAGRLRIEAMSAAASAAAGIRRCGGRVPKNPHKSRDRRWEE